MELIIRNENTLQPMGLIDDYYSIIWNVKYFTAGDFSFSVPMTARNIELLQKNRFVTRNGLKEIGVIDTVSKQRTTEGQKILAVSGLFANGLLARRVVWNATLLNGRVPTQIRGLLDSNIINPADRRRSIPSGSYEEAKTGNFIENPDTDLFTAKINSIAANSVVENWEQKKEVLFNNTDYFNYENEQVCLYEENINVITENPTTATAINDLLKNPITATIDSVEYNGGSWNKVKRVEIEHDLFNYLITCLKNEQCEYELLDVKDARKRMRVKIKTKFTPNTFFNWCNLSVDENGYINLYPVKYTINASPYYKAYAKRDYVLVEDGRILQEGYYTYPDDPSNPQLITEAAYINYYEVLDENKNVIYSKQQGGINDPNYKLLAHAAAWEMLGFEVKQYSIATLLGKSSAFFRTLAPIVDGEGLQVKTSDLVFDKDATETDIDGLYYSDYLLTRVDKIKGYAIYDLAEEKNETINLSGIPTKAASYSLVNNGGLSLGTMLITLSYNSQYEPFLRLGTYPEASNSTVYEVVEGENLQAYAESLLQSFRMGLKARFEESEKLIYFDIYQGENKTLGQTEKRPVIFSRNLDALTGFNITESSKSKITIIKVKGKVNNSDTPFYAEAGAGSGITRLESFQSLNDVATYSGADYVQSLAQTGELVLNGFERVIDAEIDAKTYKYRQDYNVGDLVTIVIDDFNLSYNVRVLEVCESYDTNGYLITLILGV